MNGSKYLLLEDYTPGYVKCAKLRALRAFVPYVPRCLTCQSVLRAHVPYVRTCFRGFSSYVPFFLFMSYVPSFFYAPYVPSLFLLVLRSAFIFLHALRVLIFYVSYLIHFLSALYAFTVLSVSNF